jgi:hypothetical protein
MKAIRDCRASRFKGILSFGMSLQGDTVEIFQHRLEVEVEVYHLLNIIGGEPWKARNRVPSPAEAGVKSLTSDLWSPTCAFVSSSAF